MIPMKIAFAAYVTRAALCNYKIVHYQVVITNIELDDSERKISPLAPDVNQKYQSYIKEVSWQTVHSYISMNTAH